MYKLRIAALAMAALLPGSAAHAAKPVYFHKPGVPREAFIADYSECQELAGGVRRPDIFVYSNNMITMAAGNFFAAFFEGDEMRDMQRNVMRTCMADKGYRRVEVTHARYKEVRELKDEAQLQALFDLAAAETPMGKVLPR